LSSQRALRVAWAAPLTLLAAFAALSLVRPLTARAPAALDARTVYLSDCAVCHGADGHGTTKGPTLEGWGRAGVYYVLTTGRMPLASPDAQVARHPPAYDDQTIRALEDYIATLVPGGPDIPTIDTTQGDLATGGEIYRAQCAACHQWAGQGGALLHREAPALAEATPTQLGAAVRTGPGAMPQFTPAAVSDEELNSVARYVQYLHNPDDRGGQPLWHLGPVAEGALALVAMAVLVVAIRFMGSVT
jgi:ubiquinol-cytochrome c reductase cytochrome c subunit